MSEEEILFNAHMHAVYMNGEYESNKSDQEYLKTSFCDDDSYIAVYYGNILDMSPSGKYYMPWCTNQTDDDIDQDTTFWEALESELLKAHLWYESGEGDALDIFVCGAYEEPTFYLVSDIPDEYQLVDLSQDIKALCESLSLDYKIYGSGCFFVLVGDGEYESVYYCDHSVPHMDYNVERIL